MAKSFIETLLKHLRETGDILPKPHGGGPQPKLNEEQLKLVKALVEADNDVTFDQSWVPQEDGNSHVDF